MRIAMVVDFGAKHKAFTVEPVFRLLRDRSGWRAEPKSQEGVVKQCERFKIGKIQAGPGQISSHQMYSRTDPCHVKVRSIVAGLEAVSVPSSTAPAASITAYCHHHFGFFGGVVTEHPQHEVAVKLYSEYLTLFGSHVEVVHWKPVTL